MEGIGTSTLRVRCRELRTTDPDPALVARIRGSVLLIAPLLARAGRAGVGEPGGDFPGRRSVATHYRALAALGAFPEAPGGRGLAAPEGLRGASFYLDEASVTATETALLAAATAPGTTEIRNAAVRAARRRARPLPAAHGGRRRRRGHEHAARDRGRPPLGGDATGSTATSSRPGSWAVAAAVTGGEVEVRGARALDMEPIVAVLSRFGVRCELEDEPPPRARVRRSRARAA